MRGSAEVEKCSYGLFVDMFRCERISISRHVNSNNNGKKEWFG
jgi:hypothetical protein